ncbi:MAG: hypothetical protein FWD25_07675 [Clostridia bacterium]|nr:hypothetical protein [Clostridia bacterium]
MKKLLSVLVLLVCLCMHVFAIGEKPESIIWMATDCPEDGESYIMVFDFEGSPRTGPDFPGARAWLLHAIGYEPGVYYVLEKGYSGRIGTERTTLLDIMHYDGETSTPCIKDLEVENCLRYVAYFDDFLYYIKWERIAGEQRLRTYYLMRIQEGMLPEVVIALPVTTPWTCYPILSERGDLVYVYDDEEKDVGIVACMTSLGEEIVAEGRDALWLDAENILYIRDRILYRHNLETKKSHVFLDVADRPIQIPPVYGAITINNTKNTLAYLVLMPDDVKPREYSELGLRHPYTVSLITGEHRLIEEAEFFVLPYLMTWWGN